jgi:hypothetical protein
MSSMGLGVIELKFIGYGSHKEHGGREEHKGGVGSREDFCPKY